MTVILQTADIFPIYKWFPNEEELPLINHLRTALKHLLDPHSDKEEISEGNYKVGRMMPAGRIYITRLKFNGRDEFRSCEWHPENRTLYIGKDGCPETEIIFIVRTIKKLGYDIGSVVDYSKDVPSGQGILSLTV